MSAAFLWRTDAEDGLAAPGSSSRHAHGYQAAGRSLAYDHCHLDPDGNLLELNEFGTGKRALNQFALC